jgi:endonuclease G
MPRKHPFPTSGTTETFGHRPLDEPYVVDQPPEGEVVIDLERLQHYYGAYKHRKDFPSPGPEVPVGTSGRVKIETMSRQERIIPPYTNLLPVSFLEEGTLRQRAVARLPRISATNPMGTPWGTGFLVSNSLILTNNHVIATKAEALQILVQFNYQEDPLGIAQAVDTWRLDPDAFFFTDVALDFTLVRVKGKPFIFPLKGSILQKQPFDGGEAMRFEDLVALAPGLTAKTLADLTMRLFRIPGWTWGFIQMPKTIQYATEQFLNIIQHPAGRMKEVALQQNQITHIFQDRIHYTTDTEPGSSGSPVFNNAWDLIGLHHAAGDQDQNGFWIDNEGMRMDSIVTHLRNQFGASNPDLLAELGIQ